MKIPFSIVEMGEETKEVYYMLYDKTRKRYCIVRAEDNPSIFRFLLELKQRIKEFYGPTWKNGKNGVEIHAFETSTKRIPLEDKEEN